MSEKNAIKLILLVILLNSADAFFTSLALEHGVAELNPIMATILKLGITWFLFGKLILTNVMILFLGAIGCNYRIGRIGMIFITGVYALLSVYHLINLCLLFLFGSNH